MSVAPFHENGRLQISKKTEKTTNSLKQLEKQLSNKTASIGIIGLGYVGLPLAIAFAEAGFRVIGFDMQKRRVSSVNEGRPYIVGINREQLSKVVKSGFLTTTHDFNKVRGTDAICICVPTPLTRFKEPDLSYVTKVCQDLSALLKTGQLVVLESTTYPGTTREIVLPILERSGLKAGQDFYLAYSPERVDPGNQKYTIRNTPKLVGGIDSASTRLAEALYRQIVDVVVRMSGPDVAEMTKVFENVFRSVNIALVNELAQLCEVMNMSVWEVLSAAASKPFGYMPFYPGPGVGGHCIPLNQYYLAAKARLHDFNVRFIELAADINQSMPYHVVTRVAEALDSRGKTLSGSKIMVLGLTYKKDVDDVRESPSFKIIGLLASKKARITYNDPFVGDCKTLHSVATPVGINKKSLSSADCVLIATDHSTYDYQFIVDNANLVFDTRGVTRDIKGRNIVRLGE